MKIRVIVPRGKDYIILFFPDLPAFLRGEISIKYTDDEESEFLSFFENEV